MNPLAQQLLQSSLRAQGGYPVLLGLEALDREACEPQPLDRRTQAYSL